MSRLIEEISDFLSEAGFNLSHQIRLGMEILAVSLPSCKERLIIPLEIKSESIEDAQIWSSAFTDHISNTRDFEDLILITEDRWRSNRRMTENRLLAHLGIFCQVYARNCEVRRIDKTIAQEFLSKTHSYGYASCRYRYGIFLKRHTGHNIHDCEGIEVLSPGKLIAVATFSNARKWQKADKEIRSYEWTRYASLPQVRINGGMGKILKKFIEDVKPDDIMSYADLEWSTGSTYKALGFTLEGYKGPVTFCINASDWSRKPALSDEDTGLFFQNLGSNKYRLKLTDYQ